MVPNYKAVRMYTEKNLSNHLVFLPMHQCYEFIVHPSGGILYAY